MADNLIGYALPSADQQVPAVQCEPMSCLTVGQNRIFTGSGLTRTKRKRHGLDVARAKVRSGKTLVVPKSDRLARSVPEPRQVGYSLTTRGIFDPVRFL